MFCFPQCLPCLRSRLRFHPLCRRLQKFFSLKPWNPRLRFGGCGVCLFDCSLFLPEKILQKLQRNDNFRMTVLYNPGQFTGRYSLLQWISHTTLILLYIKHPCSCLGVLFPRKPHSGLWDHWENKLFFIYVCVMIVTSKRRCNCVPILILCKRIVNRAHEATRLWKCALLPVKSLTGVRTLLHVLIL